MRWRLVVMNYEKINKRGGEIQLQVDDALNRTVVSVMLPRLR